ncbi:MAG: LysM peptidoglycan-binding domain-containing protein [Chitinispirillales bacterium]|nr:LysM peptidoglycan-binding domain-containing protein [Chitinispirillales bacterium]
MKQFLLSSINIYKGALFCAFLLFLPKASLSESKIFPVPDIIKTNVAFWIRIYTEVSLEEGLLHDRDYPQIVYENVKSGGRKGKALSDHIDLRRKIYVNAIVNVRDSAQNKWGPVEKRVAELFKAAPAEAFADAENRIRHQTGQRERFKEGLERSTMYLDTISAILKKHGVPDELKYLPHVESSFDAEAYSKAGAAGLWQFMRSTGRSYMRIDYMFDERRDAIISSNAAAKFLRANYNMLNEWPLTITAYNHGPNGMRRAVASVGSSDIADILQKHESATFKFASKNFYSCFIAVLAIMENPENYFKNIQYKPRFQATCVKLPFAIRPDALCKSLGITQQEFAQLNPSLRPVVFTQQKPIPAGYGINIPVSIDSKEALASLNRTPQPQRPTVRETEPGDYYTVVSGDNLHNIARRLGVSMYELASANNITNSSKIYVGQVLLIPSAAAAATTISKDTMTAAASQDTIQAAAPETSEAQAKEIVMAEVKSKKTAPPVIKDSVKITPQTAPAAKDTVKTTVQPPQAVKDTVKAPPPVWTWTGRATIMTAGQDTISAAVAFSKAVPEPKTNSGQKPAAETHFDAAVYDLGITPLPGEAGVKVKVSVDETVSHFAEWMNVSASEIRRINNLTPNSGLQMGRYISIPLNRSGSFKKFETSRLEYHMSIEEDFFARYSLVDFEQRRVKSGESLWRICNDAKIPVWLLKKFNRSVDVFALKPGNTVWIPKVNARDNHDVPSQPFEPEIGEPQEE